MTVALACRETFKACSPPQTKNPAMDADEKKYPKYAMARTKRRADAPLSLSSRVTRLTKKMKMQNPVHLLQASLVSTFPTVSTTGTLYDVSSQIAQGDDYNQRFSSQVISYV